MQLLAGLAARAVDRGYEVRKLPAAAREPKIVQTMEKSFYEEVLSRPEPEAGADAEEDMEFTSY